MELLQNALKEVENEFIDTGDDVAQEADHPDVAYAIREQRDLAKALVTVWFRERAERFHHEYKALAIEPEISTPLFETDKYLVVLQLRPDAIIERRVDGSLLQWELKTKPSINHNWVNGWEHNLQVIGQQVGLVQWRNDNGLGERLVSGAYIEALVKGKRERDDRDGLYKQQTPLIYAYVQRGDGLLIEDKLFHTWKRNLPKLLVSEVSDLTQWLLYTLPPTVTAPKAVVVPPINPSQYEVEQACEQWGYAAIAAYENALACRKDKTLLNKFFPQNTEHCFQMGKCEFYEACFDAAIAADPIGSGLYEKRTPNHPETIEE